MTTRSIVRACLLAVSCLCLAPTVAGATSFSFGTITASDTIASIELAADTGGSTTVSFTTVDDRLVIDASVSTIHFTDGSSISGIPAGSVVFQSTVYVTGTPTYIPPINPVFTSIDFMNGVAADFSIMDLTGGLTMLAGDFVGALNMTAQASGGVVRGEVSGTFTVDTLASDADFAAAFGSQGTFDQLLNLGLGSNLCGIVTTCPAPDLIDFEANPTSTLMPVAVPEPSLSLLLGAVLLGGGLALGRERSRR